MSNNHSRRHRNRFTKSNNKLLVSFAIEEIKRDPYSFLGWVQKIIKSKDEKIKELSYDLRSQYTVGSINYMRLKEAYESLEKAQAEIKALKS